MSEESIYAMEVADFEKLKQVESRLYDPKILTPDERRDLANLMNLVLSRAVLLN